MSIVSAARAPIIPGSTGMAEPQVTVAPTDTTGPMMAKYQAELMKYQADQAKQNAMWGALAGLGGAALGGWATGGFPAFWKKL